MFILNLKGARPMSPLVYRMNGILSRVVQRVPVGTNLGLLHLLGMQGHLPYVELNDQRPTSSMWSACTGRSPQMAQSPIAGLALG